MFLMLLNGNISGKSFYFGLQTRLQPPLGRPAAKGTLGHVPQGGVDVRHPDHLLAGSLQQHLPC